MGKIQDNIQKIQGEHSKEVEVFHEEVWDYEWVSDGEPIKLYVTVNTKEGKYRMLIGKKELNDMLRITTQEDPKSFLLAIPEPRHAYKQ